MSSDPAWTAERPCPADRAAQLIGASFPALRGLPVALLAEGWDNTVHVVGGTWVFRFPRRKIALPGLERELAVLPRVAARLPLPVPLPELVAADDDPTDPWPFTGARLLPGLELPATRLPEESRIPAAAATGSFLRTLHAADTQAAVDVDLALDPMQRGWPRARIGSTRELLSRLVTDRTWPEDPGVDRLLTEAEALEAPSRAPVLVHGDLHVRHLLLDEAGDAAGVIDWGDVCLADPAVDLSLAYTAFTGESRAAFFHSYGEIDADRELRARALGVRISAFLAGYAAGVNNPTILDEALAGLRRVVE